MSNWKKFAAIDLLDMIQEAYDELVDTSGKTTYKPQLGSVNEVSQEAEVIFVAFDNVIDQMKQFDRKTLNETELNTLYNYIYKGVLPEYRRLSRGGVMERK